MMMDLKTDGTWDRVRGRIRETWGALTDDDLDRTEGRLDQLVGTIKEKTGQKAEEIENKIRELIDSAR